MADKKEIRGSLGDMWMTYLPCPSLCRQCKYLEKEESNWPFHCHGGTTNMASYEAKNAGDGTTYDDCDRFTEK